MATPTIEDVLARTQTGPSLHEWRVEGGVIKISRETLRRALEAAYDSSMPNWPATVELNEFRWVDGGGDRVLQMRELYGNYRVIGVDNEGNPFRTSYGLWKRLKPATANDFRRLAHQQCERLSQY